MKMLTVCAFCGKPADTSMCDACERAHNAHFWQEMVESTRTLMNGPALAWPAEDRATLSAILAAEEAALRDCEAAR